MQTAGPSSEGAADAAAVAAADPLPRRSSPSDDFELLTPFFESYHNSLPAKVCSDLKAIGQELEACRGDSPTFLGRSLPHPLRQKIFNLLQGLHPARQDFQGLILHDLPAAEPGWDLDLAGFFPFLLRPPQPNTPAAAADSSSDAASSGAAAAPPAAAPPVAAAAAGGGGSGRLRTNREDAQRAAGQQIRNLNSYSANTPLCLSDSADELQHILFITAPCKDARNPQQDIGTYRGFVCAVRAGQGRMPAGVGYTTHDWRLMQLNKGGKRDSSWQGWVDVSVGLGVLEPNKQTDERKPKRTRSGSKQRGVLSPASLSPRGSMQGELSPLTDAGIAATAATSAAAAAAAAVGGGGGFGQPLSMLSTGPSPRWAAGMLQAGTGDATLGSIPLAASMPGMAFTGNMFLPHSTTGMPVLNPQVQQQMEALASQQQQQQLQMGVLAMLQQQQQELAALVSQQQQQQQQQQQPQPLGAIAIQPPPLQQQQQLDVALALPQQQQQLQHTVGFPVVRPPQQQQQPRQQQQQQQQQHAPAAPALCWVPDSAMGRTGSTTSQLAPVSIVSDANANAAAAAAAAAVPHGSTGVAASLPSLPSEFDIPGTALPGQPITWPHPAAPATAAVPPAAAATAAAATATAATTAAAADDLASRLSQLEVSMQYKRYAAKLVTACRKGQDLLQCLMAGGGSAQQQQQQAQALLLQVLREHDVVDKYERNLLHQVATHSFHVPSPRRLEQLELLLQVHKQLGGKLSSTGNNNGSTPLMVAASGIQTPDHAEVFTRLLQSAGAAELARPTNSDWMLLHVLANAAGRAKEAGKGALLQLLQQLMHNTAERVHQVAADIAATATAAAGTAAGGGVTQASRAADVAQRFVQLCLYSSEPDRNYVGQHAMQDLWQNLQGSGLRQ